MLLTSFKMYARLFSGNDLADGHRRFFPTIPAAVNPDRPPPGNLYGGGKNVQRTLVDLKAEAQRIIQECIDERKQDLLDQHTRAVHEVKEKVIAAIDQQVELLKECGNREDAELISYKIDVLHRAMGALFLG